MNAHPTREEDFDLYALGTLRGDEKLAIESHVAECAQCARKLAEARGRIAMLALAAPAASRGPKSSDRAPGFFDRWRAAVLVPAFAVLAIATVLLWRENRDLDRQLSALRESAQQQKQQLAEARETADMMESHDTVTVALAQQPGMPQGSAHVMYNAKMGMLMYEGEIAPAPEAKSYQLWLVPAAGEPISAGVFNPVTGRADHWMMKLPQGVAPKMFAVTLEPSGGMPQPTGPTVLIGHA